MITHGNTIKIFAGNASKILAGQVADILKMELGDMNLGKFSDGEIMVHINETVRGRDVFVIQSTSNPVNDSIMELLIMIDAMRRASAGRITAVIPYFGYARQDRKARSRDPITAKLMADIITTAGADRVLTMDLHAPQLQGFFDIPVDHLFGAPVQVKFFLENGFSGDDTVVVSPDVGSVKRARNIASKLDCKLAIIDKRRPANNVAEVMNIIGEVKGKRCIMLDDMIDTAGTIVQGAMALEQAGATEIIASCTHGVFSGPALERLENSPIKEVIVLSTYEYRGELTPKIKTISVAPLFAEAIERIYADLPLSKLYE